MDWDLATPLESKKLIEAYERLRRYTFPQSFKDCVELNNGGCPMLTEFDTDETEGRMFGFLYSFNACEKQGITVWDNVNAYEIRVQDAMADEDIDCLNDIAYIYQNFVCFADTSFGDEIAFYKRDDSVVFIDHETLEIEKIADSFEEFIDSLYEEDDDDDFE